MTSAVRRNRCKNLLLLGRNEPLDNKIKMQMDKDDGCFKENICSKTINPDITDKLSVINCASSTIDKMQMDKDEGCFKENISSNTINPDITGKLPVINCASSTIDKMQMDKDEGCFKENISSNTINPDITDKLPVINCASSTIDKMQMDEDDGCIKENISSNTINPDITNKLPVINCASSTIDKGDKVEMIEVGDQCSDNQENCTENILVGPIYTPDQYIALIKNAKKSKPPISVHELTFKHFVDLKKLQEEWGFNFVVDENGNKVNWNDIKILKVTNIDDPFTFYYKTSYLEESFKAVNVRNKRRKMASACEIAMKQLYTKRQEISANKKKDLKELISKKLVPSYYQNFYNTIL